MKGLAGVCQLEEQAYTPRMETPQDLRQEEQEILDRAQEAKTADQLWRLHEELWEVRRKLTMLARPDGQAA